MDLATWGWLALGVLLLTLGGDGLVRGASGLARRFGISPLVIGLTVVSIGTSAPELVVSVTATVGGSHSVAVGNVVGSNIFNVLVILGLCALVRPLVIAQQLVVRDVPVLIAVSVLVLAFALDGRVSTLEGALLVLGLVWFCWDSLRTSRRESPEVKREYESLAPQGVARRGSAWTDPVVLLGSAAALVLGARWLVDAAVSLARSLDVEEAIIALTIVAVGTGLPEIATSLAATLRGERDIAAGNAVGSSIFNLLGILGVAALASGTGLVVAPSIESFDLPVMTAVAVACLPLLARGHRIPRWQGAAFIAYYAAYLLYLVLAEQEHAALARFSAVMVEFVVPLTAATIVAFWVSGRSASGREPGA